MIPELIPLSLSLSLSGGPEIQDGFSTENNGARQAGEGVALEILHSDPDDRRSDDGAHGRSQFPAVRQENLLHRRDQVLAQRGVSLQTAAEILQSEGSGEHAGFDNAEHGAQAAGVHRATEVRQSLGLLLQQGSKLRADADRVRANTDRNQISERERYEENVD